MERTSSSHTFKRVFFPIPRSEFNFGGRDFNILLPRFRLNFTTFLHSDLATRNIIGNSACPQCHHRQETYIPFFLDCPVYRQPRSIFLGDVEGHLWTVGINIHILSKCGLDNILTSGIPTLDHVFNTNLFYLAQTFITRTQRFPQWWWWCERGS
jgi:hypothetical protein